MEWKTAEELQNHTGIVITEKGLNYAHSFLLHYDGTIMAWITHPEEWWWAQFDDKPPRGPFRTEAAAKLAAIIHCNNPAL